MHQFNTAMNAKPPNHPEKPQITQIHADAVTLPLSAWRGPGRRTTARNRWGGTPSRKLEFGPVSRPNGLRSASTGLATSLLYSITGNGTARQNRRAAGASVGEKTNSDGCLHPERWVFSPATGDHPIVCRSAAKKRKQLTSPATTPWCLGVLVVLLDGCADLCLSV